MPAPPRSTGFTNKQSSAGNASAVYHLHFLLLCRTWHKQAGVLRAWLQGNEEEEEGEEAQQIQQDLEEVRAGSGNPRDAQCVLSKGNQDSSLFPSLQNTTPIAV